MSALTLTSLRSVHALVNRFLIFARLPFFLAKTTMSELITKPHVSNKNKRVKSLQYIFERKW
jgi:predicted FMN-binding regulatory protein PaiB